MRCLFVCLLVYDLYFGIKLLYTGILFLFSDLDCLFQLGL